MKLIGFAIWERRTWGGRKLPSEIATGIAEYLQTGNAETEQRRLLELVLSNCAFDRGGLSPTYHSPFDLLVRATKV